MDLEGFLRHLRAEHSDDLLVGMETMDDAGVYRLSDDAALVQTVDFITPIVDDPHQFGQIAAANALSDVYAMGGRPVTALNLCCFPPKGPGPEALARILAGGLEKIREAGAVLVGGHSVEDPELKYGLAVTGTVHPDRVIRNVGLRPGDRLILTKPLGTGILSTAYRKGKLAAETVTRWVAQMATLNRAAAEVMTAVETHAATDITGFGLLGHLRQMVRGSGVAVTVALDALPVYPEALPLARKGVRTRSTDTNLRLVAGLVEFADEVTRAERELLADPQTSGGLLIAVPAAQARPCLDRLQAAGVPDASLIGAVTNGPEPAIRVVRAGADLL